VNLGALHRARRAGRRGFTLLETLLVLGLLSMLAAVLVGGSAQLLKGTARSDPEDALMALLQTLRRQSVEQGKVIELMPVLSGDVDDPDLRWNAEDAPEDVAAHEERLPKVEGVTVKILAPETIGAILLGGAASETAIARMRFYPDGTCDRVRLDITRGDNRQLTPIDPLTCAPLPAVDAK
jgi:prepilin-type N-terminal cleavage/methylation domain-containing protein